MSSGCVGMYIFSSNVGVMGLLVISMACRYGGMELGVGILLIFSFVYMNLGIKATVPL